MKSLFNLKESLRSINSATFKNLAGFGFVISAFILILLSFFNYVLPASLLFLTFALLFINFIFFISDKGVVFYFLKRVGGLIILLFIISSLTFILLRSLPGGPFDSDRAFPPEIEANIRAKYNLDLSLYKQYLIYIKNLAQGDFGRSYKYIDKDVTQVIKETLPISIQLGLYSLILAYLIGIPIGVFSASKHNSFWDRISMVTAISGISLPSFLTAPLFILFFGFYLGWFEIALWEGPSYYILPVLVLGTRPASAIARLTRGSMLDILHSDYIRTARAKGLHPSYILYKHVLKNAFIPVLTFSGPLVAYLLTGSFIIEHIFAIDGMAKHLVTSVTNRDYPLILGVTLVYCFVLIFANLIVDLLYSYFDPRIRIS